MDNEIHHVFMNICCVGRTGLYAPSDAKKIVRKDRPSTRRACGHPGAAAGGSITASTQPAGSAEPPQRRGRGTGSFWSEKEKLRSFSCFMLLENCPLPWVM